MLFAEAEFNQQAFDQIFGLTCISFFVCLVAYVVFALLSRGKETLPFWIDYPKGLLGVILIFLILGLMALVMIGMSQSGVGGSQYRPNPLMPGQNFPSNWR